MQQIEHLNNLESADRKPTEYAASVVVAEAVTASERAAYQVFVNPNERMEYMRYVDDLITTIDGTAEASEPYDAVVYLDSSARPVSWMVDGLWGFAARKDEQGKPLPKPIRLFANIDARRTGRNTDTSKTQVLHDTYQDLAAWNDADMPKRVLVVDE